MAYIELKNIDGKIVKRVRGYISPCGLFGIRKVSVGGRPKTYTYTVYHLPAGLRVYVCNTEEQALDVIDAAKECESIDWKKTDKEYYDSLAAEVKDVLFAALSKACVQ